MTRNIRIIKDLLWFLALWGLVASIFRLHFGLGATTNLTDAVPWGLWKILKMVAGVAMSTSGFTVGFLVLVLRLELFRPLLRPAILVAFLGYGSSCLALLFDIGLPLRFWHPFIMWNEHSFLFEVFWCVMLYFSVTFLEVLPTVLERYRIQRVVRILHGLAFGVAIVGISLSSLHHSSLGSLFLVTPQRLHSLWYSSLLPLFFILSAMGGGLMFLVLIKIMYARWYQPETVFGTNWGESTEKVCSLNGSESGPKKRGPGGKEMPMLRGLATIAAAVLSLYLVLKLGDLVRTGAWRALLAGTWESVLYGFEILISAVLPIVLVSLPGTRRSPTGLALAAFSASAGLALNRLDVGIFGYWRDAQTIYFPSLAEWAISLGVVAAAGLVFLALIENFAIFEDRVPGQKFGREIFHASFDAFTHVWNTALTNSLQRVSLIAVFVVPLAWVAMYPPYRDHQSVEPVVEPPMGLNAVRTALRIDGNRAGVFVDFHHADHQQRLGGEESCGTCHHVSLPNDRSTPCSRCHRNMVWPTDIFDHSAHVKAVTARDNLKAMNPANQSCAVCHAAGQAKCAASAIGCVECHQKDMWLTSVPDSSLNLALAASYQTAMHGTCVNCHKQQQQNTELPANLAECGTCHRSLQKREILMVEAKLRP